MSMKILIVEDDPNLLEALKFSVRKEGFDAITVVDGVQALEVARREKPDLILLDGTEERVRGLQDSAQRDDRTDTDADRQG